ncbi:MFS transporter [Mycobacterium sp. NAZ190054]|uniref:MFS transporter n=1 Tax=Mycobacterium sp. NAZ190054 TaxID=1747766 RepID=UPI00079B1A23|nr:MFS transporter [Mycobacterium sp. NAZ190054]KWX67509.1 MFS transporter [Mycobacterium sp. NAZ190054]
MLATLCLTQITSWGVLYYAFTVLSVRITDQTGWSQPAVTAAFSAALVTSALTGILVGRRLDRHGPHVVMTAGSVLGPLALAGAAVSPNFGGFVTAWLAAGVAMGAVLYQPAFAALTRWYGPRHVRALTVLTLVAGLASTVFAPLTALLADHLDWRTTYLVLAAALAVITVPAHFFGLRHPWPPAPHSHHADSPTTTTRSRAFIALTAAIALAACASYAIIVNLVPLMTERGISTQAAALALGLGGVGQVLGRLGYGALTRRLGVRTRTVLILSAIAVTTALLGMFTSLIALVVVTVLAGFARGILTLLQATAVTDRWGPTHYGHLSAVMAAPVTVVTALGPWIGAALASLLGGYAPMFVLLGVVAALAALLSLAGSPTRRQLFT